MRLVRGLPPDSNDAETVFAGQPVEPWQRFSAEDWDCEGFGNGRNWIRSDFPAGPVSSIDLGADELGDLVMSGYFDGSRIFGNIGTTDRSQIYFWNLAVGTPYLRPSYNLEFGGVFGGGWVDWQANVQNTLPIAASPFTDGRAVAPNLNLVATLRHLLTPGGGLGNKPAFMRNWRCDFSPHLLPDFHPLWAQFPTTDHDTYACNPWFDLNTYRDQRQDLGSGEVRLGVDNPFLYYNPAPGYRAWPGQIPTRISNPPCGALNPPGTGFPSGSPFVPAAVDVLTNAMVLGFFGPLAPCSPPPGTVTYAVGPQGFGDTSLGCPDQAPYYQGLGIRVNCQVAPLAPGVVRSNLQTFLLYSRIYAPPGLAPQPGNSESDMERLYEGRFRRQLLTERDLLRIFGASATR
jgi:hypothetical protein